MDRQIPKSLKISLLLGLALAAISTIQVNRVSAQSNTPTYVLGVTSPTDPLIIDLQTLTTSLTILPGVSSLSLVSPSSILFIDGNWLQSVSALDPTILTTITTTVLTGLPTIVVRGNPALLQQSITGFPQLQVTNLPLISDGIKVLSTLSDGTRQAMQLQVLAGFDYAVNAEFTWAQQLLTQTTIPTMSPALKTSPNPSGPSPSDITNPNTCSGSTTDPCWQFIFKVTIDTGTDFFPAGQVTSAFSLFHLINSGTTSYTWNNLFLNETIQPGIAIYNSPWRNFSEQNSVGIAATSTNTIISDGPASLTTSGPTQVGFTIGTTNGVQGAAATSNQTATYMLKNSNVTDSTSATQAAWLHSINTRTVSGKLLFSLMEGFTDRVSDSQAMKVVGSFVTTFATLSGQVITGTQSRTQGFTLCAGFNNC